MRKLVSIIVPVYNEEESLLVFHDSVTQVIDTLSNYDWEILYINDGSTDQTQTIIQQLFEKDKRGVEEKKDELDDIEEKNENEIKTDKKELNKNISNEIQNLNFGTDEFNKAFQNKINLIKDTKSEIIKYIKLNK